MPRRIEFGHAVVLLCAVLATVTCPALPLFAQGQAPAPASNEPNVYITDVRSSLTIVERFSKAVEFANKVRRVDGFDPAVINVTGLTPNRLRVQAVAPGVTTMIVVDEHGQVFSIEIFVAGDIRHLQAYIDKFFPKAAVQAVAVRDSVVLRGWVTKPEHITELIEIADLFYPLVLNHLKVGGVQQVLLKVKIIEVQRSKVRKLGMNLLFRDRNGFVTSTPGDLTPIGALTTALGAPPFVAVQDTAVADPTVVFGVVNPSNVFTAFIEALKQESLLKILAEPELIITNGRPANMLAGGEFPILVPQSLGSVSIEWREFGTRLEAVPIILSNDRLRLQLQPEVSDRDFANAVEVGGLIVPGLTTRRVNTEVEMRFGQTLMIAGLLSRRNTAVVDKIPFLGELPWIGAAFRRIRYDETETELIIMVTPELVAPLNADQVLPGGPGRATDTPTDREFYGYGWPEAPYWGDHCIGCEPGVPGTIFPTPDDGVYGPADGSFALPPQPPHDGAASSSDGFILDLPAPAAAGKPSLTLPQTEQYIVPPPTGSDASGGVETSDLQTSRWRREPSSQATRQWNQLRQAEFSDRASSLVVPASGNRRPTYRRSPIEPPNRNRLRRPVRPGLIEPKPGMIIPAFSGGR